MRRAWMQWVIWGIALGVATIAMLAFRGRLDKAHVTLIYLLLILLGTVSGGRLLGFSLAAVAFLLFNWFFLVPYGTLRVNDPLDWLVLAAFLLVSGVAAEMLHRLKREAELARQRAAEVNQFAVLGAEALNVARPEEAIDAVAEVIRTTLHLTRCRIHADRSDADGPTADPLVTWVREHGGAAQVQADGTTHVTDGLDELSGGAGAIAWYLPLRVRDRTVGVLELRHDTGVELGAHERRFLRALSYYAALGIERARLATEARDADALREADRLKNALLASVSHDLRTPLTTIKALAHDMGTRDDRAVMIEEEADRLNRLVADLLDLSRLQGGAIPLHIALNAVDDLIGALMQRVAGILGTRTLEVEFQDDSTLLVGRFDLVHALRILVNLIENAHKYSPPSDPVVLRISRDADMLRFAVIDRGPGIPLRERERIFEPFYRPAGAIPDSGSAGLGLSIARQLAELQGGTLTIGSTGPSASGATFELTLPAADLPVGVIGS
ncbi:MAG TPA: ATP-binding protein [Gemmatimonadales bacterium]|jgi:two-component system sensor histidine kinase KdpD